MYQRDRPFRLTQLKETARLLIQGISVRDAQVASKSCGHLGPLSIIMVDRLRKDMFADPEMSRLKTLPRGYEREFADRLAEKFADANVRRERAKPKGPVKRGRPPKAPATPVAVVGVWQKAKASAGAGMEKVIAAANGSAIGRKPYIVTVTGPSSLEARSPGGRRAYSFVAEKPLKARALATALKELKKLIDTGLRLYHDDHELFGKHSVRTCLRKGTFVALASPTETTERERGNVGAPADAPPTAQQSPQGAETRPLPPALIPDWS